MDIEFCSSAPSLIPRWYIYPIRSCSATKLSLVFQIQVKSEGKALLISESV